MFSVCLPGISNMMKGLHTQAIALESSLAKVATGIGFVATAGGALAAGGGLSMLASPSLRPLPAPLGEEILATVAQAAGISYNFIHPSYPALRIGLICGSDRLS
jgi:hypothetical protein